MINRGLAGSGHGAKDRAWTAADADRYNGSPLAAGQGPGPSTAVVYLHLLPLTPPPPPQEAGPLKGRPAARVEERVTLSSAILNLQDCGSR